MEKLYVFGTGNAAVTHCYNTCFAINDDNNYFMVDAGGGNGILRILEDMQVPLNHIHHIFVTHEHNDHILGMVWMVRMIATEMLKGKYDGQLTIYCHKELIDTIKTLCRLTIQKKFCNLFDDRIVFDEVTDGCHKNILGHEVYFFDILSTKAKQFGFVFRLNDGRKVVFAGDEPINRERFPLLNGADWLLTEAFCLYDDRERFKPYEKHHSTVKDAALLAEENHVPHLLLWHTEDKTIATRKEAYTAEGKEVYHGEIYVPEDGEVISL